MGDFLRKLGYEVSTIINVRRCPFLKHRHSLFTLHDVVLVAGRHRRRTEICKDIRERKDWAERIGVHDGGQAAKTRYSNGTAYSSLAGSAKAASESRSNEPRPEIQLLSLHCIKRN